MLAPTLSGSKRSPDRHHLGERKVGSESKSRPDRPPSFLNINRSKRSIAINLKTDAGRNLVTRLASVADVVVENFSAGVMDRLQLGYDHLRPLNPRLIYVSMSGYGHNGPRRNWTSMNMNLQAYTGLMMTTGSESDPPVPLELLERLYGRIPRLFRNLAGFDRTQENWGGGKPRPKPM